MLRLIDGAFRRAHPAPLPGWGRLAGVLLACTAVGWLLHMGLAAVRVLADGAGAQPLADTTGPIQALEVARGKLPVFLAFWNLSIAVLATLTQAAMVRSRAATEALFAAELGQARLEREMAAARAQLLQAQVEPHFLFNAMANVRRLLRTERPAARALLDDLLRYLQEALPALREEITTLGREAELVRAYLSVHQVRMGPRLRSQIDVPPDLAGLPVPPMMLLTLVENALKHGLQPMVEGGSVQVAAARSPAGQLVLTVADTGRGMGSGHGHGTGLANVRARLKSIYGTGASLALAVNEPRGVVATITLPDAAR
jgi:LytS/YehU family sensor histidine kinase